MMISTKQFLICPAMTKKKRLRILPPPESNIIHTIESIPGTTMDVSVAEITRFDEYQAVIPEIRGSALYTGTHEFRIDPSDPPGNGFMLS